MIVRLSDMPDTEQARSLNDMVTLIEQELTVAKALERFSSKTASYGYAPLADYNTPRFLVSGTQGYRVTEAFPRLIRSQIPQGLASVSYNIRLEAITSFACKDDELFGTP